MGLSVDPKTLGRVTKKRELVVSLAEIRAVGETSKKRKYLLGAKPDIYPNRELNLAFKQCFSGEKSNQEAVINQL